MKKQISTSLATLVILFCYSQVSKVGVNTDNPQATLHVVGDIQVDSILISQNPEYFWVSDSLLGPLKRISKESLFILLGNYLSDTPSVQTFPDIISSGYSTMASGSTEPPAALYRQRSERIRVGKTGSFQNFFFENDSLSTQKRNLSVDWPVGNPQDLRLEGGAVILDGFVYVLAMYRGNNQRRVYRYLQSDLNAGGARMNFSGMALGLLPTLNIFHMTTDGTYFYFSYDGGNSSNSGRIAKYSVSDTIFTYISSITLGAACDQSLLVDKTGNYYCFSDANNTEAVFVFSSTGTFIKSRGMIPRYLMNWSDNFYNALDIPGLYFERFNK